MHGYPPDWSISFWKESMDSKLLEILVCPICKGSLEHRRADRELLCTRDRLAFPIHDGIPVMLESEARSLSTPPGGSAAGA
jgi:uncharacterized protein YbaR (Trm112 family)